MISIRPVTGLPEIAAGDHLSALLGTACEADGGLENGDILVVTHKVVSKAEGRTATVLSDADYRKLVEQEAASIIRRRGDLVITRTMHGFVCANAAVDRSNTPEGTAVLLPTDPDRSAHGIRRWLEQTYELSLGVIVSDTFGRAWRVGQTDVAIGISGVIAILDLRGTNDADGRPLTATEVAVADELAGAADLAMGKATGVPAAIIRGAADFLGRGRAVDLVRHPRDDFFL